MALTSRDPLHAITKRVSDIHGLSDAAIRCAALGRHIGFGHYDPIMTPLTGWGNHNSWQIAFVCDCGRWRKEAVDIDTGERLTRSAQYGGGMLMETGFAPERAEARVEWYKRVMKRRRHRMIVTDEEH